MVVNSTKLVNTVMPLEVMVKVGTNSPPLLTKAKLPLLVLNVDANLSAIQIGKIYMDLNVRLIKNLSSVLPKEAMEAGGLMLRLTTSAITLAELLLCVLNVAVRVLYELTLLQHSNLKGFGHIMVGRLSPTNVWDIAMVS